MFKGREKYSQEIDTISNLDSIFKSNGSIHGVTRKTSKGYMSRSLTRVTQVNFDLGFGGH